MGICRRWVSYAPNYRPWQRSSMSRVPSRFKLWSWNISRIFLENVAEAGWSPSRLMCQDDKLLLHKTAEPNQTLECSPYVDKMGVLVAEPTPPWPRYEVRWSWLTIFYIDQEQKYTRGTSVPFSKASASDRNAPNPLGERPDARLAVRELAS